MDVPINFLKMGKYLILLSIVVIPLYSLCQYEGTLEMQRSLLDAAPKGDIRKITIKIWYLGRQSIQQVPSIAITQDTISNLQVKYYLFIDSASSNHAYFTSFSDTAQLIAYSVKPDLFSKYGGWNLHSKEQFEFDNIQRLNDTVIRSKRFVRYNLTKPAGSDLFNFIVYGSCAEKHRILYVPSISKRIGCPVLRMDTYYNGRLTGIMQIEYGIKKLSAYERRVFNAWQKRLSLAEARVH